MKPAWYEAKLWSGMSLGGWTRLLLRNRLAVSPSKIPTAAAITCLAASNSALRAAQWLLYGRRVRRVEVPDDPVFIIGHWRTGTTMLHELLGLDPANRCPTTYECLSPCHFLLTEKLVSKWFWFIIPRRRPMDNVRVGFDRPQEDEAAMCNLGLPSAFLTVAFPNRPQQDPRYVDFDALTDAERRRWLTAHRRFLQRVLCKRPGQLILKSPQHTFRLRHLLDAYPKARLVHMARHPYTVFPSTRHFWTQMYDAYGLQRPRLEGLDEMVLDSFAHMQRQLDSVRERLARHRFVELRYEDLVQDAAGEMERVYQGLELSGFEQIRGAVEQYAGKRYKPNQFSPLPRQMRSQIAERWRGYFERYGYDPADGVESDAESDAGSDVHSKDP